MAEFISTAIVGISNTGAWEIELASDGQSARVKGSWENEPSDWGDIVFDVDPDNTDCVRTVVVLEEFEVDITDAIRV